MTTDPGPKSTAEEAKKADDEALELVAAIYPLNRKFAVKYIRENPPSPEVVAALAFAVDRSRRSKGGRKTAANAQPDLRKRNREIQKLHRGGLSIAALAKRFERHQSTIRRILKAS